MGLKEFLARRKIEERIARKTRLGFVQREDPDEKFLRRIRSIDRRINHVKNKVSKSIVIRKESGKQYLLNKTKSFLNTCVVSFKSKSKRRN